MSSEDHNQNPRGDGEIHFDTKSPASSGPDIQAETMKRAAAKQQIERYYYQLTDGCGNQHCSNDQCASCPAFSHHDLSRNQAALRAIELFKAKACLCEVSGTAKVARSTPTVSTGETSSSHPGLASNLNKATTKDASETKAGSSVNTSGGIATGEDLSCMSFISATASQLSKSLSQSSLISCNTQFFDENPNDGRYPVTESHSTYFDVEPTIPYLTEKKLHDIIEQCKVEGNWSNLIKTIWSVFSDTQSLIRSFRKEISSSISKESMEADPDKDVDEKEMETDSPMEDAGGVLGSGEPPTNSTAQNHTKEQKNAELNTSSSAVPGTSLNISNRCEDTEITLDLESLRRAYTDLFAIENHPFQSSLLNALRNLASNLEMELKHKLAYEHDPNYLNIVFIVMEIPQLHSPEYIKDATTVLCKALGHFPLAAQVKLARIWSTFPACCLKDMVTSLQQMISITIVVSEWTRSHWVNDNEGITGAARILKVLYYASILGGERDTNQHISEEKEMQTSLEDNLQDLFQGAIGHEPKERRELKSDPLERELNVHPLDCRKPLVAWDDFINEPLNDNIEMDKDYTNYKTESENHFSFMTHSFLLTTATKNLGLYYDNRIRMINERRASALQSIFHQAPTTPYLRLRIRRDHVIDDALVALEMAAMDNPQDLKKQLYVEFEGEQGIDEGGVSKEFFQLVVEEIFNPDIGMFVYDEETKSFWFNPTSFENDGQFTLIGIMLGLAIYNSIILDVHFPMVVYRKLMGKKGTFEDLKDSHPTLARGLQGMLEYDGEVADAFMQMFSISFKDVFGDVIHHELKEDGLNVPVTNENRQEFVDLYADYLLNKSVEKQFKAFFRGFTMVTDESPLKMLFRPEEIELLVCGSKLLDFLELEKATEYDGGFEKTSPTIMYFWEIVHMFSDDQKRQLLQFTTGSDRVPVGGLSKLKLIIAKNGPDSDRLPTSHTCFNVLLLPDYSSKAKLEERLLKAITHAKGFGML